MKRQKADELRRVDALTDAIEDVRRQLECDLTNEERSRARDRLDALTKRYREAETMPTWPIDRSIWRWLTIGNAALVIPLVSQVAALAGTSD
jgi:hypothetical protein